MTAVWTWLKEPKHVGALTLAVTALVALGGGGWTVFQYLTQNKSSIVYKLCIGPEASKRGCSPGSLFVPDRGPQTVPDWAKNRCAAVRHRTKRIAQPKCVDCYEVEVTCGGNSS
jgi:hypothetical protein